MRKNDRGGTRFATTAQRDPARVVTFRVTDAEIILPRYYRANVFRRFAACVFYLTRTYKLASLSEG
jgi:hypothetical protein